ncbi:MAG: hypothetical protein CK426_06090 [Legionella sp.]|nr:MAG: hypothetical protein CK423_02310 [Legionella sp.]PJD98464.1 MAG: hypothetical protein CK426_06090 [Legionella sp.]
MSNDKLRIDNILNSALFHGVLGTATVATGAAIRGNSVSNEAVTVLVGGMITGAMAAVIGCALQPGPYSSSELRLKLELLQIGINVAAFFCAPAMGELVMNLDVPWGRALLDELIGCLTIDAGLCGVIVTAGVGYGAYKCVQHHCSSSFFKPAEGKVTVQLPTQDLESAVSLQEVVVQP